MPGPISQTKAKVTSCVSCGLGLVSKGSSVFICPNCDTNLGRCGSCREQAVDYACPSCGHQGP